MDKKVRFRLQTKGKSYRTTGFAIVYGRTCSLLQALDQLRSAGSTISWHGETRCNKSEEKAFIWTDGTSCIGRLREGDGKGKLPIVDIILLGFL